MIFRELDALPDGRHGGEVREQLASFATGAGSTTRSSGRRGPRSTGR